MSEHAHDVRISNEEHTGTQVIYFFLTQSFFFLVCFWWCILYFRAGLQHSLNYTIGVISSDLNHLHCDLSLQCNFLLPISSYLRPVYVSILPLISSESP